MLRFFSNRQVIFHHRNLFHLYATQFFSTNSASLKQNSKLSHLLKLPDSLQKFQEVLALVDSKEYASNIQSLEEASLLYDCVLKSGSLRHMKELHRVYNDSLAISPAQYELLLDACDAASDAELCTTLINEIFHKSPSSIRTSKLNKAVSTCLMNVASLQQPHSIHPLVMPFESNFLRSYETCEKLLNFYQKAAIECDSDAVKMIIAHFFEVGDFETGVKLIECAAKTVVDTRDTEKSLLTDLIAYAISKCVMSTEDDSSKASFDAAVSAANFRQKAKACFEIIQKYKFKSPEILQIFLNAIIESNFISLFNDFVAHLFENDLATAVFTTDLHKESASLLLRYDDYEGLLAFFRRTAPTFQPTVDMWAEAFDSITAFDAHEHREQETERFRKLQRFLARTKSEIPAFICAPSMKSGLVRCLSNTHVATPLLDDILAEMEPASLPPLHAS